MASSTDPARELAEFCEKLSQNDGNRGDIFLAGQFGVNAWSQEFYQIIFCVIERANYVEILIDSLDLDEDFKLDAKSHIEQLKQAFSHESLFNGWSARGAKFLSRENVQPIKMLSPQVRLKVSYPKLEKNEIEEILAMVLDLEKWLLEHQIKDNDFIRQAILEGISQFRFRFERLSWLGWGYTIESLRDVIGAYLALEKGTFNTAEHPDSAAVLLKVGSFLKSFYEKAKFSKDFYSTGEFILKMYGAVSLALHGANASGVINLLGKP